MSPKPFLPIFMVLLFILFTSSSHGQVNADTVFTIIHLPRKTGYSKEKLNQEIVNFKEKENVRRMLRSKNFPPVSILIEIRHQKNTSSWWTIDTENGKETEINHIILQSRDGSSLKFYKLGDIKSFFKDTVAILDTLTPELFIHDPDYPDDQYYILTECSKNNPGEIKIPLAGWKLIFTKELLANCPESWQRVRIFNKENTDRILANCTVTFISEDQKEAILSLGTAYGKANPGLTLKEIAVFLQAYTRNLYGNIYYPQFFGWLDKNLK